MQLYLTLGMHCRGAIALISDLKKHAEELVNTINNDFLQVAKRGILAEEKKKHATILAVFGAAIGIFLAGMGSGLFLGDSPSAGRIFSFVLGILLYGGGLAYILGRIGKWIGKGVFERRWKDQFGQQEERLNKISKLLPLTLYLKKYNWKDVLNSAGKP